MDNTLRKAAEMALEAFQSCRWDCDENNEPHKTFNDILVSRASEALHAALAQPANQSDCGHEEYNPLCQMCMATKQKPWDTSDMAHRTGGLNVEECIDRGAWSDVPDATKWVDELRGDEDSEQEPVAWDGDCVLGHCGSPDGCDRFGRCRAAPPRKPWVSLTDEEIEAAIGNADYIYLRTCEDTQYEVFLTRAIEAALWEKNNG